MTDFVGKGLAAIAGGGFFCDDPPTFRSLEPDRFQSVRLEA